MDDFSVSPFYLARGNFGEARHWSARCARRADSRHDPRPEIVGRRRVHERLCARFHESQLAQGEATLLATRQVQREFGFELRREFAIEMVGEQLGESVNHRSIPFT